VQPDQSGRLQLPQSFMAGLVVCNTESGKLVGRQRNRLAFANLAAAIDHHRQLKRYFPFGGTVSG
jgi:hypothetical protein